MVDHKTKHRRVDFRKSLMKHQSMLEFIALQKKQLDNIWFSMERSEQEVDSFTRKILAGIPTLYTEDQSSERLIF